VNYRAARFALTYFHTVFSDLVEPSPSLSPNALADPTFAPYVLRNVSDGERAAFCGEGQFYGLPDDCLKVPIGAIVDLRLHNRAVIETTGFDLNTRYSFDLSFGRVSLGLLGTYLLDYAEAPTSLAQPVSVLNTEHNPINLRLRGSAAWTWGPIRLAGFLNYQNSYNDVESVPTRHVSSWTTVDSTFAYEIGDPDFLGLKALSFQLSALNLLNRAPPFLNNWYEKIGYDEENGDLTGRNVSLTVRMRW
jgi:outer membrane receptor protein involved in Fe transport